MKFYEFKYVVEELCSARKHERAYLDSIPYEFSRLLTENDYADRLEQTNTMLIESFFGDYAEDVKWFIYEAFENAKLGSPNCTTSNGEYTIIDLESYFDYAEKELDFDDIERK